MYSHVRHRSLDETYINQLLNLFSTAFSSNSLKGDALAALRLAYPVASLRKCLPSGQRLFKACSGPSALAQLGFAPLEPPRKSSTLSTLGHTKCFQILRKVHRTFLHIFHHFVNGLLAPCILRQWFHPCNLKSFYYIQCITLCNK